MKKHQKATTLVVCSLFLSLIMSPNIAAQQVYTAETQRFIEQWQQYKQKTGKDAPTLKQIQDNFGLVKTEKVGAKGDIWAIPVFISFASEGDMEKALPQAEAVGFEIQTKLKTICTGLLPVDKIQEVGKINGILQIQAVRKVKPVMDKSRKACRVDSVQMGVLKNQAGENVSYKGEGVVIGIVDGGFDYTHPNFYDPDQTTLYRVKRVWDQNKKTGTRPTGYDYGAEYSTQEAILAAKNSATNETHATHVSGIAAGSGAGTEYKGMAPKADLVFVACNFYDQGILDGVKYIKDYSKTNKQACAINLSLGGHVGPHDGTSAFDRALDELKSPGFVVVGSAGNEGADPLYIGHTFTASTKDTLFYTLVDFYESYDKTETVDLWSNDNKAIMMSVAVIKAGGIVAQSPFISSDDTKSYTETLKVSGSIVCKIGIFPETSQYNNKQRLMLDLDASSQNGKNTYKYMLIVKSKNTAETASSQMWVANGSTFTSTGYTNSTNTVKKGTTDHTVGEVGSTSNSILSVGSYTTRTEWQDISGKNWSYNELVENDLSYFSSHGPTADGRVKPDITSPGAVIFSSYNSYDRNVDENDKVKKISLNGRDYFFGIMQGTSMAAPAVTGIMALWLQAHPDWQIDSVRKYFKLTAINDSYTGPVRGNPSNLWGPGKIDAFNALVLSAGTASVPGVDPPTVDTNANKVPTIADLIKKKANDATIYTYTGKAAVTMVQDFRNQKWIQDATSAIMIDDPEAKITTNCAIGEAVTSLKGNLQVVEGVIKFKPTQNIEKVPEGVNIILKELHLEDLYNSIQSAVIQNELITLKGVRFADPASETTPAKFVSGQKYRLTDGKIKDSLFSAFFSGADYISTSIPKDSIDITGLVILNKGKYTIAARKTSDIIIYISTATEKELRNKTLKIYPNPNNGAFTVVIPQEVLNKSDNSLLQLFDTRGRNVWSGAIDGENTRISGIEKGFYVLRLITKESVYTSKVEVK